MHLLFVYKCIHSVKTILQSCFLNNDYIMNSFKSTMAANMVLVMPEHYSIERLPHSSINAF